MIENTKETAMAATDRADRAANSTGEQAQQNKEEAAGFLQQVTYYSLLLIWYLKYYNYYNLISKRFCLFQNDSFVYQNNF